MTDLTLQLANVMRSEIAGLDAYANNAANLSTPGYRSERPLPGVPDFARRIDPAASNTGRAILRNDGPLQTTGIATDLALRGDGWFLVETDAGPRLTRDGRFHLDARGALRTRAGHAVQGDAGDIANLPLDFQVSDVGVVSVEGKPIVALRIVRAPEASLLTSAGEGLYRYAGTLEDAERVTVMQGGYETSNVDVAADMIQLMQTTRHIESLQRSISAYDQMLGTGINQLGKP